MVTATHSDATIRQCHARVYARRPRPRGDHVETSKQRKSPPWVSKRQHAQDPDSSQLRYRLEAKAAARRSLGPLPSWTTRRRPCRASLGCRSAMAMQERVERDDRPLRLVPCASEWGLRGDARFRGGAALLGARSRRLVGLSRRDRLGGCRPVAAHHLADRGQIGRAAGRGGEDHERCRGSRRVRTRRGWRSRGTSRGRCRDSRARGPGRAGCRRRS